MLKAELHTHINLDPEDHIEYTVYDLIDRAHELKYDFLAITMHNKHFCNKKAVQYAENKGIVLISGIEKKIRGKDVLVYTTNSEIEKINGFDKLKKFKEANNCFIIAPHPFYPLAKSLHYDIIKYFHIFDAWEHSWLYSNIINPNKKLLKFARKYKKPIIGNSDVHDLKYLGSTYSLVKCKKTTKDFFNAIKAGKVKIVSKKYSTLKIIPLIVNLYLKGLKKKIKKHV